MLTSCAVTTALRGGVRGAAIIAPVEFADFHEEVRVRLAPFLQDYLEEKLPAGKLRDACAHLLCRGKMVRATAALAAAESFQPGFPVGQGLPEAASLEFVQTFTLIHDDLPEMDNADIRRGVPSVHREFGSDYALLAGDTLLDLGFLVIVEKAKSPPETKLGIIEALSRAIRDVMEGQARELALSGKAPKLEEVEQMQWLKTGSLIAASFRIGALLAHADVRETEKLEELTRLLGRAYQVKDDLLSVEGEQVEIGKTLRTDELLERPTMVRALGLAGARRYFERLQAEVGKALDAMSLPDRSLLSGLTEFLVARRK